MTTASGPRNPREVWVASIDDIWGYALVACGTTKAEALVALYNGFNVLRDRLTAHGGMERPNFHQWEDDVCIERLVPGTCYYNGEPV